MSHRSKIIKEWVDITINEAGQKVKGVLEVDKLALKIIGINLVANFEEKIYFRGSQKITINEMEIFPEGYESKMMINGLNVPVNERMIKLGEDIEPGNRRVEIEYKDTEHPASKFSPYRVRLYVFSLLKSE